MSPNARIVLVAVAAGILGLGVSLLSGTSGPLLGTPLGQRVVQAFERFGEPSPASPKAAGRLPPLRLQRLDAPPLELPGAYAGRPLLVNFWASWCAPCIEEMPELDRYAAAQGQDGVQVIGIALDEAAAVRAFLDATPVAYPIALDEPGPADSSVRLGNRRGVLPYTVLIAEDGRILHRKLGPFRAGEIEAWVEAARESATR